MTKNIFISRNGHKWRVGEICLDQDGLLSVKLHSGKQGMKTKIVPFFVVFQRVLELEQRELARHKSIKINMEG